MPGPALQWALQLEQEMVQFRPVGPGHGELAVLACLRVLEGQHA